MKNENYAVWEGVKEKGYEKIEEWRTIARTTSKNKSS